MYVTTVAMGNVTGRSLRMRKNLMCCGGKGQVWSSWKKMTSSELSEVAGCHNLKCAL